MVVRLFMPKTDESLTGKLKGKADCHVNSTLFRQRYDATFRNPLELGEIIKKDREKAHAALKRRSDAKH